MKQKYKFIAEIKDNRKTDIEGVAFGIQIVLMDGWKVLNAFFLWYDLTIGFIENVGSTGDFELDYEMENSKR